MKYNEMKHNTQNVTIRKIKKNTTSISPIAIKMLNRRVLLSFGKCDQVCLHLK